MNRILFDNREAELYLYFFSRFMSTGDIGKFDFTKISCLGNAWKWLKTLDQIRRKLLARNDQENTIFQGGRSLHISCHGIEELEKQSENLFLKLLREVKARAHWFVRGNFLRFDHVFQAIFKGNQEPRNFGLVKYICEWSPHSTSINAILL